MILLEKILSMTINGSVMILLILLIRYFFAKKMSRKIILFLWEIAFLILMFPIVVKFRTPMKAMPENGVILLRQVIDQPTQVVRQHTQAMVFQKEIGTIVTPGKIFLLVYLTGLLIVCLLIAISYFRSRQIIKQALPINDPRFSRLEKEFCAQLPRRLKIRQSDCIISPVVSGIFFPTILIPSGFQNSEEDVIRLILTHEVVHIQRWDNLRKLFSLLILCLHWFNPLIWFMYHLYNNDLEIVCDRVTLDRLGNRYIKKYAYTLIYWQRLQKDILQVQLKFSKSPIKERVEILLNKKKKSMLLSILMVIVVIGTGLTLITKYTAASAPSVRKEVSKPITSNTIEQTQSDSSTDEKVETKKQGSQMIHTADYKFTYLEKYQEIVNQMVEEYNVPSTSSGLSYETPTKALVDVSNNSFDEVKAQADSYGLPFGPSPYYVNRRKEELTSEEIALFEQLKAGVTYLESEQWLVVEHPEYENPLEQYRITYLDGTTYKTSFVYDSNLNTIVMISNEDYPYGQGYGVEVRDAVNDDLEFQYQISKTSYGQ